MSADERLAIFIEVCELAHAIVKERADVDAVLRYSEPMPPWAEEAWLGLVAGARDARSAR